jgi:hypothetical protein
MTDTLIRLRLKLERKTTYLTKLANYFKNQELLELIAKVKEEVGEMPPDFHKERKIFFMKCKNNKLRFIKKKYENLLYNNFSNVAAFHLKQELKQIPTIGFYSEVFDKIGEKEISNFAKLPSLEQDTHSTNPASELKETGPGDVDMTNINLPVFEFKLFSLVDAAVGRMSEVPISIDIPKHVLRNFITNCLIVYNHVPYHNFSHGFSVFQVFWYYFLQSQHLNQIFSKDEMFVGLVACLSHDLGHRKSNQLARTICSKSKRRTDFP